MAEYIQFYQTAFDGVIVEVGRNDAAVLLVSRVLDRRKVMDVHVAGDNHDPAGMLARRTLDAGAAADQAVDVGVVDLHAPGGGPFHDVAVGRLILDGADGAGAEYVVLAEQFFRVFMGLRMVFAGEIQVDIRYLVAVEAQENREGDVVTVLMQRCAALRAFLIGQVEAAADFTLRKELAPLAVRADVMRRQGIDLRNVGHSRHEGRADGPTGAYEVAVVIGMLNELMGDVIEHAEAVAQDRRKFFDEPVLDDLRQGIAVNLMGLFIAHVLQGLRRAGNLREVQRFLRHGAHVFNHFIDLVGIGNDDFASPFFAEVSEFFQHFVSRAQVQVGLELGVLKALAGHEDFPVYLVFRVEEVGVARRDGHLAQLVADAQDRAVDVPQAFVVRHVALADEEAVVRQRLDFQIVVIIGNFLQFFIGQLLLHHRTNQFARFAGRAEDKPFAVLVQDSPGNTGTAAVDVFQMGNADQLVQVADADLILRQDDDVVGLVDFFVEQVSFHTVNDLDIVRLIRRQLLQEREGLDDAVVCDGDGRMAPFFDGLNELLDRNQGVHVAHDRMEVELDARRRVVVFPFDRNAFVVGHDVVGVEDVVVDVRIVYDVAAHADVGPYLHALGKGRVLVGRHGVFLTELAAAVSDSQKLTGRDAVRRVGNLEGQEDALRFQLAEFKLDDFPLNNDVISFFAEDFRNRRHVAAKGLAVPDAAVAAVGGCAGSPSCRSRRAAGASAVAGGLAGLFIVFVKQLGVFFIQAVVAVLMRNIVTVQIVRIDIGYAAQSFVVASRR